MKYVFQGDELDAVGRRESAAEVMARINRCR
jgi:hypothetical protein